MTKILIKRLDPTVPVPSYAKAGDAGADLATRIDFTINPGERMLVPTGISIALPNGYVALVHPRSGLAIKHGMYSKVLTRSRKLKAHDESNSAGIGDRVLIMETRPLSATKRWRVVEILEKAK